MTVTSEATTVWKGGLFDGSGETTFVSSGLGTFPVNWKARSEGSTSVTTPEELIAAAHAACFSMALSHALAQEGSPPERLEATATVTFVPGTGITKSALTVRANVPGMDEATFLEKAEAARVGCPVSKALAAVPEITLDAALA